jgi:hypothetical protein
MRTLGRRRYKWDANIKINSRETGYEVLDWILLSQDREK